MYYINMENIDNIKYVEIGRRIRDAREKEGLTQGELAHKLGYSSPTAISLIESGERKIRIDDLELVAKTLHRELGYFISGSFQTLPDVQIALRADKTLDQEDISRVEDFIDALRLAKKRKNGGRGRKS